MSNGLPTFAGRYSTTLRKFTTHEREADLIQAYALGRKAIAGGYGVLDMARVHQASLEKLLRPARPPVDQGKALCTAETFFLESLSPFEATHRGFRETNQKLQQAVAALERRNQELGIMNRRLKAEARDRQKSQRALRKSAVFYRALFRQARAMEENLRHLSNQIVHVQEEERRRISRELHDETGQALTAISVTLASLGRNGAKNGDVHRVREAQRLLENTMESLHDFALELRPASLDELGLLPALRTYLKNFAKRTGLEVNFLGHP
jgi:two-component system sensor histidine kinase DegS